MNGNWYPWVDGRLLPCASTASGLRHGASTARNATSSPETRTVSARTTPPACDTSPAPLAWTWARGYEPVECFTRKVPLIRRGYVPGQDLSSQLRGRQRPRSCAWSASISAAPESDYSVDCRTNHEPPGGPLLESQGSLDYFVQDLLEGDSDPRAISRQRSKRVCTSRSESTYGRGPPWKITFGLAASAVMSRPWIDCSALATRGVTRTPLATRPLHPVHRPNVRLLASPDSCEHG